MATIVVGTDGSPGARQAVDWALGEARLRGAEVRLVHAWMLPLIDAVPETWVIGVPPFGPGDEELVHEKIEAAALALLQDTVAQAREQEPTLSIEGELVEAHAAAALIAVAHDADLLVIGSRGRGGFTGLLLGSVGAQCVHHARCPVVVVPPDRSAS